MNAHGRRLLDEQTADQLLAAARRAHGPLADRLSVASVAAFPGELAGEEAALAAFRAAADVDPVRDRRRSAVWKSAVAAKLLTLKAAVVAVVAVSVGGLALAANTGVLPNPLAPEHPTPASTPSNRPEATPSPSLVGLCTAYLAGAGEASEHVLANTAFTVLVSAAGGADHVVSFCNGLGVTAMPGPSNDHPNGAPSQLPTPGNGGGKPTARPVPSHP